MRRKPGAPPLFIVCQRAGCGKLREVRRPCEQQHEKYCSRRCAAFVTKNCARPGVGRLGGLECARRARRALVKRLDGLTPLEAFRLGYDRGLQSKHRQIRRRRQERSRGNVPRATL